MKELATSDAGVLPDPSLGAPETADVEALELDEIARIFSTPLAEIGCAPHSGSCSRAATPAGIIRSMRSARVPVRPDSSPNPWEIARLRYWNGSVH